MFKGTIRNALNAGGDKAAQCTLILVEGEAAVPFAETGITIMGNELYGVFALRGKLQNVRKKPQIKKNGQLHKLQETLGLEDKKVYDSDSVKSLRYGHLMIITDQDYDGIHIRGLLISYIHFFWPSLLKLPNFLMQFITPIVKAIPREGEVKLFYTMPEYQSWEESLGGEKNWDRMYYKGLRCHSVKERTMYFKDHNTHVKYFTCVNAKDEDAIDMAFSKKRTKERKACIKNFKAGTYLDYKRKDISYSSFVHQELILYFLASIQRSIPSMVDGLKTTQRKILYSAFNALEAETKTESLVFMGEVKKRTLYHHGRKSLYGAILDMTKDYVGSNNINLFNAYEEIKTIDKPDDRYISISLNHISRKLFPKDDDIVLNYLYEAGQTIEPKWFVPVIPLILVNGCRGVAVGWNTFVPNYDPKVLCDSVRVLMMDEKLVSIDPCFKGFQGTIERDEKGYISKGVIKYINKTKLEITSLPVNMSTEKCKKLLDKTSFIEDYVELSGHFIINISKTNLKRAMKKGLVNEFNLTSRIDTSGMRLLDSNGVLKKYNNPEHILKEFFQLRLQLYEKRKKIMLEYLKLKTFRLEFKEKIICDLVHACDHGGGFTTPTEESVLDQLKERGLLFIFHKKICLPGTPVLEVDEEKVRCFYDDLVVVDLSDWKLLKLRHQRDIVSNKVKVLKKATPEQLWMDDLNSLDLELEKDGAEVDRENLNF